MIGKKIAEFVQQNYPVDSDCVNLSNEDFDENQPDWLGSLPLRRIATDRHEWELFQSTGNWPILSYDQTAAAIQKKQDLLSTYRTNLPGYKIWLLLGTRGDVLETVHPPREIPEWEFKSDFDRVLFVSWSGEVVELKK